MSELPKPNSDHLTDALAQASTARDWRCFHCDEVFTDPHQARLHFGKSEHSTPACQVSPERLRELESMLDAYCQEDTELHRAMWGMQCRHRTELIREEEKGYARGLADGMKEVQRAVEADEAAKSRMNNEPRQGIGDSRREPQWQPMETAPKGERILMLMKHGAIEGQWDGETGSGYYWRPMEWYPSHWMPLPEAPKEQA